MLPHIHHLIHLQALGYLVRDEDHRDPAFEPVDGLRKMLGGLLIQVRNRLVENQHLGTLEQRPCNRNPLALPKIPSDAASFSAAVACGFIRLPTFRPSCAALAAGAAPMPRPFKNGAPRAFEAKVEVAAATAAPNDA